MAKTIDQLHTQAKADFAELQTLLEKRGIFTSCKKEDFVSQVWALPIDTPTHSTDGTVDYIDFNFKSISTSLSWEEGEEHPQLSTYIDIWEEEPDGFEFITSVDIEEI